MADYGNKKTLQFSPAEQLERGTRALEQGRFRKAVKLLKGAVTVEDDPKRLLPAHANLCVAHYQLKAYEEAETQCNAALAITPDHYEALVNRGNIHFKRGEWEAAAGDYEAALKTRPGEIAIAAQLIRVRAILKRAD
ncbi:MAG: tetratricopeptide repeat protein [Pseudomonadota bacterium]